MSVNQTGSKWKRARNTGAILMGFAVLIIGIKAMQIRALSNSGGSKGPPPTAVATQFVKSVEWIDLTETIGTITPKQGVMLSTELPGTVDSLNFESGQRVAAGEILLRQDHRLESAELSAANAISELAQINYKRSKQLLGRKTISQSEFDLSAAEAKKALAQVEQIESRIQQKIISAPFAGSLGIRQVQEGQYLKAGEAVVSLQADESVYVNFYLPQSAFSFLKVGLPVSVSGDALGTGTIEGEITAIANEVDSGSRMLEVQATLPNLEGKLASGMYVNVSLSHSEKRKTLVVPLSAIVYASYGNSIYLSKLDTDGVTLRAEQVFVELGKRKGDYVEVLSGVSEGNSIVTDGAFKLYPGAVLMPEDSRAPSPEFDPNPSDT